MSILVLDTFEEDIFTVDICGIITTVAIESNEMYDTKNIEH